MPRRHPLRLVLLLACLLLVGTVALAHVHPAEEYAGGDNPAPHCELCVQLDRGPAPAPTVAVLRIDLPALGEVAAPALPTVVAPLLRSQQARAPPAHH
jgi:hypothetical protein